MTNIWVHVSTAFMSITQNKLRSILSILGIVCGVVSLFTMVCISEGAKLKTLSEIEALGTNNIIIKNKTNIDTGGAEQNGYVEGLSDADHKLLNNNIKNIEWISGLRYIQEVVYTPSYSAPIEILSVSSTFSNVNRLSISHGRFINEQDAIRQNMVIVIGESLAHSLAKDGAVGSRIRIGEHLFTIIGIIESPHRVVKKPKQLSPIKLDNTIIMPVWARDLYYKNPMNKLLDGIVIRMKNGTDTNVTAKHVMRLLELNHTDEYYNLIIPQQLIRQAKETQKTFNYILGSIAGISLIVGGIGIMNIMLASISERRKEIGIRRAVGASQKDIMRQFMVEAMLLTSTGGVFGIVGGLLAIFAISRISDWPVAIVPWSVFLSISMSLCVGVACGFFPAKKASQISPMQAIRAE